MKTFECRVCSGGCRVELHGYDQDSLPECCVKDGSCTDWVDVAQPQENKDRAENSPASPVQQLKAEIAAIASELQTRKDSGLYIGTEYIIRRLRQLSAI